MYLLYLCSEAHRPQCLHLPPDAQLPCTQRLYFSARRFFHRAKTDIGWTDLRALSALERFYRVSEIPFSVDRAFWANQTPFGHGSGVMFDIGADLSARQRDRLRCLAVASGLFASVAAEAVCPNCIRVKCMHGRTLRLGDRGVFVFSLQAALREQGCFPGVCSGIFCRETERALIRFQRSAGLCPTGIADAGLHAYFERRNDDRR